MMEAKKQNIVILRHDEEHAGDVELGATELYLLLTIRFENW